MRKLWLVVVVGLVVVGGEACGKKRIRVSLPDTAEANECRRQCMVVEGSCTAGRRANQRVCHEREQECLATCPGAVVSSR